MMNLILAAAVTALFATVDATADYVADSDASVFQMDESLETATADRTSDASMLAAAMFFGSACGELHGTDTVDYSSSFYVSDGVVLGFTATAAGAGTNKLTVKLQAQKISGNWKTLKTITVKAGSSGSGSALVPDLTSGSEKLRFRLSRGLGTKGIDWCVYW